MLPQDSTAFVSPTSVSAARKVANVLRVLVRISWGALARRAGVRKLVLAYHSVGRGEGSVPTEIFARQMAYLAEHAKVVTLERLLSVEPADDDVPLTCAITFDDGYANFYERAFPVLDRFRLPALIYVVTDTLSATSAEMSDRYPGLFPGHPMLTWRQLRALNRLGVVVGSHLCLHRDMTLLDRDEAMLELSNSRKAIADQLGDCTHFAYPFGRFNNENVAWVREAGYSCATTVEHRPLGKSVDRLRIPRMCIAPFHDLEDFRALLRGDLDYLFAVRKVRDWLGLSC